MGRWSEIAMRGEEFAETSRDEVGGLSAEDVLGRLQELADAEPGASGHSLDWAVAAHFLGDMTAVASMSLRSRE